MLTERYRQIYNRIRPHSWRQSAPTLGVAAMIGLQFQRLPIAVGDEGVIAVSGEEGELGTGCRLHPPDNEPRRRGVRLGL